MINTSNDPDLTTRDCSLYFIIFRNTERTVYEHRESRGVVGYLTQADNLNVLVVRNAGHMVPLSQPVYAQQMIEEFTDGSMSK